MNVIQERLSALRTLMKEQGMDAYLVPAANLCMKQSMWGSILNAENI